MKYLGIDFGTKRVGLAISDEAGGFARPLMVVKNDKSLMQNISSIIAKEGVGGIVIGISKTESGADNKVTEAINDFIGLLTFQTMLPIEQVTEAFTSFEAHPRQGKESRDARMTKAPTKPADLDARAAAIILQRFLDKKGK